MAALAMAAAVATCGGSSPASPSNSYAGAWSGTLTDSGSGSGTWQMTLSGTSALAGSWSASVSGLTIGGTLGELPPPAGGSGRYFGLSCSFDPLQGGVLLNAVVSGNTATGSYQSLGCAGLATGTVRLTRR
jgi:hypothetical protein